VPQKLQSRQGRRRPNLTEQITEKLRARLENGDFKPGDRLPTEQVLISTLGVSRTVVREAIAALRADGLVEARQGAGVFATNKPENPFGLSLLAGNLGRISAIIEVLELRAALESEAAALAAERSSPAETAKIRERYDDIGRAISGGGSAENQDFEFHLAIAEATRNRHFVEFFRFLGERTIPRNQLHDRPLTPPQMVKYLEQIQSEHLEITKAIETRSVERARAGMRSHLRGSQDRYRRLIARAT